MPAQARNGKGRYTPDPEVAERRRQSALLRSRGGRWQEIADAYWSGDTGTAVREVKKFWAQQPRETVEEIRAAVLAKLDGLEQDVRKVMARRHYVVAEGHLVRHHTQECDDAPEAKCRCPKLEDDAPIYQGVDRVRQLVETQLKLIPGLAVTPRQDVAVDQTVSYVIKATPGELENL